MEPTLGPSGADTTQVGTMLALRTLLFGILSHPPYTDISSKYDDDLIEDIDGLVQEICNCSVLAMELHLSCTNPLI